MNGVLKHIISGLVVVWATSSWGATFVSALTDSQWSNTQNSKLVCELTHSIENYGQAVITQKAGEKVVFSLQAFAPARYGKKVNFSVEDPNWLTKKKPRFIKRIPLRYGTEPVRASGRIAQQVLVSLAAGHWPTFTYHNGPHRNDKVIVKLSSVNFQGPFANHLKCVTHLLRYGYEDIKKTKVHFENKAFKPRDEDYATLAKILKYLKYDKSIKRIVLKGYSDNVGGVETNYSLSVSRANAIRDFLMTHGIEEKMIETQAYGRRFPIANNQMPRGRLLNRRVEIELKKV